MIKNTGLLFMEPVFKEMIWGGNRLATEFGYNIPGDDTGECWGISAHPNGDCTVKIKRHNEIADKISGRKLSDLWANEPWLFGKHKTEGVFPLLTKIIDAKADLSIQVHPDDSYANEHENGSLGKNECWYILDCANDATLVVGHNAKDPEECANMIRNGRWNEFIREIPVKKGDFVSIIPGTVHAIKSGIMLLETQQNSDITYRVYDYDRLSNGKKRELHVDKSIDVITSPALKAEDSVHNFADICDNEPILMDSCKYYKVWKLNVTKELTFERSAFNNSAYLLASVVSGEGIINHEPVKKGDHFIIPATDELELDGNMELIISAE